MRIGIELNNIVRNINYQAVKYYKKGLKPDFEDEKVNLNVCDVFKTLDFTSNKAMNEFKFVDYPYEIFGCARVMERNLSNTINTWLLNFYDENVDNEVEFSLWVKTI